MLQVPGVRAERYRQAGDQDTAEGLHHHRAVEGRRQVPAPQQQRAARRLQAARRDAGTKRYRAIQVW